MTLEERKNMEDAIAKMQKALDDPWRAIRDAQNGWDPIITEAITRQYKCLIAEFKAKLSPSNQPVTKADQP